MIPKLYIHVLSEIVRGGIINKPNITLLIHNRNAQVNFNHNDELLIIDPT